jgi:hypothetical protein
MVAGTLTPIIRGCESAEQYPPGGEEARPVLIHIPVREKAP